MNRTMRLAAGVVVVLLLAVAAPASAMHSYYPEPLEVLHEGTAKGSFWTAYRVKTNGGGATTHMKVDTPTLPSGMGGLILDGRGKVLFGIVSAVIPGGNGAYVDVNMVPGVPIHYDLREPTPEYPFWDVAMNWNGPGTPSPYVGDLTFVWWTSGASNKGVAVDLRAQPNVTMVGGRACSAGAECTHGTGWESGSDTFVYLSDDFTGAATLKGGAGAASARANYDTHRSVTVDHSLLAGFLGYGSHADVLKATTPTTTIDCTLSCFPGMNDVTGPQGPGKYTFTITAGAGGGPATTYFGEVVLNGADVILPGPSE